MEHQVEQEKNSLEEVSGFDHSHGPLPIDFQPNQFSVVIGRGRGFNDAAGNQRLKVLATYFAKQYKEATNKKDKTGILLRIVQMVEQASPGSGFVTLNGGRWWTVDEHTKRDGVARVLRDLLSDKYKSSSKSKVARRRVARDEKRATNAGGTDTNTANHNGIKSRTHGVLHVPNNESNRTMSPSLSLVGQLNLPNRQQQSISQDSSSSLRVMNQIPNNFPFVQTPEAPLQALLGGIPGTEQYPIPQTSFNREEHYLPFNGRVPSSNRLQIDSCPEEVVTCNRNQDLSRTIKKDSFEGDHEDDQVTDLPEDLSTVFE